MSDDLRAEFEEIAGHIEGEGGIDAWRIAYETTRDDVAAKLDGGVMPSVLGTIAMERLRPEERDQAQLELYAAYSEWLARQANDDAVLDRLHEETLLEPCDDSALQGEVDRQPGRMVVVERDRLARVLAELERLQTQAATDGGEPR